MADFTPQEQEEFEFRLRLEQEQAAAKPKQAEPVQDKTINPLVPTLGGALAAEALGPAVNKASNAYMDTQKLIASGMSPDVAHNLVRNKYGAVEAWGRQMHGGEFFGGRDFPEAYRLGMESKYPGGIPATPRPAVPPSVASKVMQGTTANPMFIPESFEAATKAAPSAAGAAARSALGAKVAASPGLQSLRSAVGAALPNTVPAVLGRGLAGGAAAFEGVDAYNRLQQGDITGGVIGGLGALGSAASLIPHPVARIGGTAIGMGAAALNAYLDSLKEEAAAKKKKPTGGLPQQ